MSLQNLTRFPRLEFIGAPTPLEYLPRFSDYVGRDIFIKRDDVTPMAMGGNKLRKLEFLAADALREGADTLITAGAIQSNHVRQTAAVAAKLGLHCVALLENPIGTRAENYLTNGNRLLLDLFNVQVEMVDALTDPTAQLDELATRLEAQGFRPYVIPVGGSNALGALGYVESALEIAQQCEGGEPLLRGCRVWQCRHARRAGGGAGAAYARGGTDRRDGVPQRCGSKAESGHVTAGGGRAAGA